MLATVAAGTMRACRRTRSREALPSRSAPPGADTATEAASLLARARRSPRLAVILVAAAAFAAEMAVSTRYGYHRDELYFLEAGRHPAFGYVDQPPLTPLAARLGALLFANSLVGLRVLAALGLSALVLLTAGMSRILGAGRAGQVLAAVCAAGCAEFLGGMHLITTTTLDFVAWGVLLYLVLRLLDSGEPRWWLAIGLCTGVAAEAKWTIWFLAAAVVAGFAVTPQRRLLRSRYLLLGALIAVALAAPDLIWQAAHGWPNLDVFRSLHTAAGHNRATYWQAQVLFTGLALTPIWVTGLVWGLRSDAATPVPAGRDRGRDRDRAAVLPGRQGVLLRRRLYGPARGRLGSRGAVAVPRAGAALGTLGPAGRRGGRDPRSRAHRHPGATGGHAAHGAAAEHQLRPGRDDRLAP